MTTETLYPLSIQVQSGRGSFEWHGGKFVMNERHASSRGIHSLMPNNEWSNSEASTSLRAFPRSCKFMNCARSTHFRAPCVDGSLISQLNGPSPVRSIVTYHTPSKTNASRGSESFACVSEGTQVQELFISHHNRNTRVAQSISMGKIKGDCYRTGLSSAMPRCS